MPEKGIITKLIKVILLALLFNWKLMINILERKHAILVTEFDRYVVEHPEFAVNIPRNAQIVLQVEGDEQYNEWSMQLAERQREIDQRVVYVKVKGLKPARSRLLKPKVAVSA